MQYPWNETESHRVTWSTAVRSGKHSASHNNQPSNLSTNTVISEVIIEILSGISISGRHLIGVRWSLVASASEMIVIPVAIG